MSNAKTQVPKPNLGHPALRVGDYRVRFHDQGDTIRITAVKHRREAYR
jgi:mRNA-degrading endonuclease RelE of RelBE toxin-antitoxin system